MSSLEEILRVTHSEDSEPLGYASHGSAAARAVAERNVQPERS